MGWLFLPVITGKKSLRKAAKRIYQSEYAKAKAEALRKARAKARKELQKKARAKAFKKYGLTSSEKKAKRKKQLKDLAKRMNEFSKNIELGFDSDISGKKKKKKKSKSIWDLDIDDLL